LIAEDRRGGIMVIVHMTREQFCCTFCRCKTALVIPHESRDGVVIDEHTAIDHHLFDMSKAQRVRGIPAHVRWVRVRFVAIPLPAFTDLWLQLHLRAPTGGDTARQGVSDGHVDRTRGVAGG
jgi:hypothetical protein